MKSTLFLIVFAVLSQAQMAHAEMALPRASSLEGRHQGQDNRGVACEVTFEKKTSYFGGESYDVTMKLDDATPIKFNEVKLSTIDQKIVEDTEYRQNNDKDFSYDNINFSIYRPKGIPTPFGRPTDSLSANWYQGTLSWVGIVIETKAGPFVDPRSRISAICFLK